LKKIYFVRHCSADGQHKDSPLTIEGTRQAQLLSIFLTENDIPIDRIISSPYLRAVESIKPYAEKHGIDIEVDERLHERVLSNEPVDDWLEVLEHSFKDLNFNLPGGESANDTIERANQVLNNVFQDEDATNVMLVTHGNLIALTLHQYDKNFGFDQWKELRNPDIYAVHYDKNGVDSVESIWRP